MIKKAVFPVAGLGTRFLPATKASPKEMLPIVDKPLIQYAAEEAVEAGQLHDASPRRQQIPPGAALLGAVRVFEPDRQGSSVRMFCEHI